MACFLNGSRPFRRVSQLLLRNDRNNSHQDSHGCRSAVAFPEKKRLHNTGACFLRSFHGKQKEKKHGHYKKT